MKFGRFFCGVTAAVMALGSVEAYAAEEETQPKFEIVTVPLSEIHNADAIFPLGRGVFGYNISGTGKTDIDGFVYIDVDKFAETGKLSYTDITVEDFDLGDDIGVLHYTPSEVLTDGDYFILYYEYDEYYDEYDDEYIRKYIMKYDEKSAAMTTVREWNDSHSNFRRKAFRGDGTDFLMNYFPKEDTMKVKVTKADGTSFEHSFQFQGEFLGLSNEGLNVQILPASTGYCYAVLYKTTSEIENDIEKCSFELLVVDNDGNANKIDEGMLQGSAPLYVKFFPNTLQTQNTIGYQVSLDSGNAENGSYYAFVSLDGSTKNYYRVPAYGETDVLFLSNNSVEILPTLDYYDSFDFDASYGRLIETYLADPVEIFDDVAIMSSKLEFEETGYYLTGDPVLFDFKNNRVIGDPNFGLYAGDGEIFMVDDMFSTFGRGFIDKTGNELGMFNYGATMFKGDYATVGIDGEFYLIDRDMNIISDGVEIKNMWGGGWAALDERLCLVASYLDDVYYSFGIASSDDGILVAYRKPSDITITDYTDEETDITVTVSENAFDEEVSLVVTPVSADTTADRFAYDIKFVNADGAEVQPKGEVTVKLPIPEALTGKTIYVFRAESGKYTDMNAKVEDGYAVFTTNHFSEYILTTENLNGGSGSGTGGSTTTTPSTSSTPSTSGTTSTDTSSEPTSSTPGYTESADSTPESSASAPSGDNANPSTGVALSVLPIVAAISAVVVIKKKK